MRREIAYLATCLAAGLVPFLPMSQRAVPAPKVPFPGWPQQFEGKPLLPEPMLEREKRFYGDFPGHIARFRQGERQIIFRWVGVATRKFHLTPRCYKALGYTLSPLPERTDATHQRWGGFEARHPNGKHVHVYERISDASGHEWSEESAWRWDYLCGRTSPPWWGITVVEP